MLNILFGRNYHVVVHQPGQLPYGYYTGTLPPHVGEYLDLREVKGDQISFYKIDAIVYKPTKNGITEIVVQVTPVKVSEVAYL